MDQEKFRSRLADAGKYGKLNLGFCELTTLPASYIREIRVRICPVAFRFNHFTSVGGQEASSNSCDDLRIFS